MSSYLSNGSGWKTVNSENGQLLASQIIQESQIIYQKDNPTYFQQWQPEIIQSQNQNQSDQRQCNMNELYSVVLVYLGNYENNSSQIKEVETDMVKKILEHTRAANSNDEINKSVQQYQNINQFNKQNPLCFSNKISTGDNTIQYLQTNPSTQCFQETSQLQQQHASHLIQALKGNISYDRLDFFNSCIQEIQFLCDKKSKLKISLAQKEINQVRRVENFDKNQIEKQIPDQEEKGEAQVDQEEKNKNKQEHLIDSELQQMEQQKREELKKQQTILNSLCGLCLDPINSLYHENLAPKYFTDIHQYFQAKCGHYMSKICLATMYTSIFQDSIPKTQKEYLDSIQKKLNKNNSNVIDTQNTYTYLNCNHCNYQLSMDEVLEQNRCYLTHVRQNRKTFECGICIVDYDLEEEGISMFDCDHIFCIHCLTSYIIQCINQNKFRYEDFKCPQDKCTAIISNYVIDRLMNTPENQMLFNRMIRMQLIHSNFQKEKIALCPGFQMRNKSTNKIQNVDQETITLLRLGIPPQLSDDIELIGCTTFFSYDEKKVQFYECANCKYKSCLRGCEDCHQKGSKRGKNCSEFEKWKKQNQQMDKDIMAIFDKDTMCQCPKCKAVIIRNGGCNHMTCTMPNCGFQFCFKCQSKWLCWKHFHYF